MDHHGELILGKEEEDPIDLPPGFRFHPTDEELITHYLCNKVMNPNFTSRAIGDVDLNKCEPWDLPWRAKMGEKEWYFFCVRDRKYPTGLRTNRATEAGYWKATGKDKDIYMGKNLVGMKKTLVFYRGRAPKGEKSNWVMHEYRLEGKCSYVYNLPKPTKNEWVICRIFNKSVGGKRVIDGLGSSLLPPLMDLPSYTVVKNRGSSGASHPAHVTCFSSAVEGHKGHEELLAEYYNPSILSAAAVNPCDQFSLLYGNQGASGFKNIKLPGASLVQLLESNGFGMKQRCKTERERLSVSQETGLTSDMNPEISSVVSNNEMNLEDCLWNY